MFATNIKNYNLRLTKTSDEAEYDLEITLDASAFERSKRTARTPSSSPPLQRQTGLPKITSVYSTSTPPITLGAILKQPIVSKTQSYGCNN